MTRKGANAQAQALRDSAIILLQEAAQSSDSAARDTLTRKALAQIGEARRLLNESRAHTRPLAMKLH